MKKATIIIDNFTLQDVGTTLANGLNAEERSELRSTASAEGYNITAIPSVGVQIETLLQLLSTIILHDELIVDQSYIDTWKDEQAFIQPIADEHLLLTKPFDKNCDEWQPLRSDIEDLLCFTPQLLEDFTAYKAQWKPGNDHPFSPLIWGTAGMLARSAVYKSPYLGHPSRSRIIQQSLLSHQQVNAQDVLRNFINTERVKLFEKLTASHDSQTAILNLPPLALEVIAESSDISQLIPTAIQLRDKYQGLRQWIAQYQYAVTTHDKKKQAKSIATLKAAASDINSMFQVPFWARMNLKMNFSITGLINLGSTVELPIGAEIQRRMKGSVRSAVTNLIKQDWDNTHLEKLFKMFEETNSSLKIQAIEHLRS